MYFKNVCFCDRKYLCRKLQNLCLSASIYWLTGDLIKELLLKVMDQFWLNQNNRIEDKLDSY